MKFRAVPALRLLASALFASLLAFSQTTLPSGVTKVTSVEGITEYRLDNGLRLLVFPDPSKPTITVNITYLVGSRHEGTGEGGMAHLLEHMVFKGSPRHTNIPQELTEHGARPNGTTDYDRTNYFETFGATDENLKWALDLESDRMVNSFIKKSDFDKEFSVVRNEFEMGENNPFNVTIEHTMATAYLVHSYGKPVIGNKSDVERVPIDKLQAFYHKFYQPDNAVLTVAGKVDEAKIVSMVNDYFGKIPKPTRVLTPTYTVEPAQDGERMTVVRRVGDIQVLLSVYHIPDGGNADIAALNVLSGIMGEPSSGRLYKALVDNKKATQVFAFTAEQNEPGAALFGAVLNKTDSMDDARKIMLDTIAGVIKEPPSKDEVDRARTRQIKNIDMAMLDSTRIGLFMSEYIAEGDWRMLFLERDRLKKVTPQDVQRVAAAYFKPSNQTIGEFIPDAKPERAEIPSKTDLVATLQDFKGSEAMSVGEAFDPSPQNIDARTTRFTLPSGMTVALLDKKTRGGSVQAFIRLHFGNVDNLHDMDTPGSLTAQTLIRGTAKMNRQQIQDEIDRLKAQINVFGSAQEVNVSIETTHDNLPAALALGAQILKEATLPDSEFEQVRKSELTQLEDQNNEPQALAPTEGRRILYPFPKGDVRAIMSIPEQIDNMKAAKVADARSFYQKFYGASHAELTVVGDFDQAEVKKTVEANFGQWKSNAPYQRITTGFQTVPAVNRSIETPDKANAMWVATMRMNLSDHDPDYPAVMFGNYLLGGGFLNSRLATRIRVKDGLSYGVASQLTAKPHEPDALFFAYAIAAPQNVEKVEAAFKEEVARALKDGFTPEEVAAGKTGWLQSKQVTRSSDQSLANILASRDYDHRTMAFDADLEKKVNALQPADITAAMRRHIDLNQMVIVKAGDFKKAAPSTN